MYEVSLQVPLVIYGRWRRGAGVLENYVDHYDSFRTICELARVQAPISEVNTGRILRAASCEEKWSTGTIRAIGEYGDLRMIRDQCWKLVFRYPAGPHDLFDLKADPLEANNLYQARHGDRVSIKAANGRILC